MIIVTLALSVGFTSCKTNEKEENHGVDIANMDTKVDPKEDFYNFVNGGWEAKNSIPSDQDSWGSFNELRKKNDEVTLKVLKNAMQSGKYTEGTDEYKAMLFFNTAMDTVNLNKHSKEPLKPYLEKIDKIKNITDFQNYIAEMLPYGMHQLFGYSVFSNLSNSSINSAYISPTGFGLPERGYYVDNDADTQAKRDAYVKHIARMFNLVGIADGEAKAKRIMALETQLSKAQLTKEERRNLSNMNNPMTVKELAKITPSIDWESYFKTIGTGDFDTIIVMQPKYMAEVEKVLKSTPVSTLKDLLEWEVINSSASLLDEEMENANFDFYSKTLTGVNEKRPREERMLAITNGAVGEAVGKLYVAEVFPPEAKKKAKEMVDNILVAFGERIDNLTWMSDTTKQLAHKKLNNFMVQIGYPDEWKDYSDLTINSFEQGGSFLQNVLNTRLWNFKDAISKLGKPVDKTEWGMAPQTVNAYYSPLFNKIVFPAAILQPPFYDYKADEAVNYGGIGAVIGHEISHGFDDSGARFDDKGNLNNWWTDNDKKHFTELGNKLIKQFDAYEPYPGLFLNGTFTLGENIGDLGGVNVAFHALENQLKTNGSPAKIDGFTAEQRFFISWATIWRTKMREEAMRNRIKTDPHAPGMYRATAPLLNTDGFYKAFNIKEGDKMYVSPENRVKIW